MITDYEIELVLKKFKHHDKLIVVYMYKDYVFGIVSEMIPDLRLPQVTRDEFERCARTDGGEANLLILLAARCIFTSDKAREVKVLQDIMDDSWHESVITKDEISKLIREEIETVYIPKAKAMAEDASADAIKIEPPAPPPTAEVVEEPKVRPKPQVGAQMSVLDLVSMNLEDK